MGDDLKKILGYAMVAAAIVGTIINPGLSGAWKYLYAAGVMSLAAGGSMLLNQVARREMQDELARAQSATAGLQANTRSGQMVVGLFYGRHRVGGNILYMKSAGSNNQDLHIVYGIGEGEIDAIEEVWFNDDLVWEPTVGNIEGPYHEKFEFDWRPGTQGQTHFAQITAIDADFGDRYKHTAVAYLKLIYDQNVWQGVPQVNFVIRGRKVYDPRDSLTKWTQTGPLEFRDVFTNKRFGAGILPSKVDDILIGEAATYAEQSIARTGAPISVKQFGTYGYGDLHANVYLGWTSSLSFSATAPWGGICPGTLVINFCGVETFTDNGAGNLAGSLGGTGTVNYSTNAISLVSAYGGSFPPVGDEGTCNVQATYRDGWRTINKKLLYVGVKPGTLAFASADESVTDNGAGNLIGSLGGSGTINYATGDLSFTFKLSVPRADPIVFSYQSDSSRRFMTNWFALGGSPALDALRELLFQFRGILVYSAGSFKLLIDKPGVSVASFRSGGAEDSGNNIIDGTFSWQQAGLSEIPTRIRAKWIDPLETWKVKDYLVDLDGINTDRRELAIELYSCTHLDVVERIARTHGNLVLQDIKCNFKTNLAGLILEPGDLVTVTHPAAGWVSKKFRVVGVDDIVAGEQVALSLVAYADSCYIDDPQSTAITPPNPSPGFDQTAPPPQVTGLTLTEFWRMLNDGTYSSWIKIAFTIPSNYAYYEAFEIYMRRSDESAAWRWIGETRSNTFEWGPVKEGVTYSFKIVARNVYGVRYYPNGPVKGIVPTGKTGGPTTPGFNNPACSFTDRVVLNWAPIADKDLGNYELRTDLNWGNATNRLYLGKATSFWMQAASASYTFYLKTIDTSGNYSSGYGSIALTNGAPTGPTVTTDYIGRDCIVKWGPSPDLDFLKWVLTIYSDAARTTLKRTVEMTSPGYIYTYDQIQADFGGAGVPGTIYFRIVTHDLFGSTATTDFSASQATPAIVQYDGAAQERVRIGALGGGSYGARFRDSAGNITFEQGDTLKQQYMKLDELLALKLSKPLAGPFTEPATGYTLMAGSFDGNLVTYMDQVAPTALKVGMVDFNMKVTRDLFTAATAAQNINECVGNFDPLGYDAAVFWDCGQGTNGGLYFKRYAIPSWTVAQADVLVEAQTVRHHRFLLVTGRSYDLVFVDDATWTLYFCRLNPNGTFALAPVAVTTPGVSIRPVAAYNNQSMTDTHLLYRRETDNHLFYVRFNWTGVLQAGPTDLGAFGQTGLAPCGIVLEKSDTLSEQIWLIYCPESVTRGMYVWILNGDGSKKTNSWFSYGYGDSKIALIYNRYLDDLKSGKFNVHIPLLVLGNLVSLGPGSGDKKIEVGALAYQRRTNLNLSDNLICLGIT